MKRWHEAQMRQLHQITDTAELVEGAYQLAIDLGFDYIAFVTRTDMPASSSQLRVISNLPDAWCLRYQQQGYASSDPTISHCQQSVVPLLWSDSLFDASPLLRQDAWQHGIRHGLSLAVHDAGGQISMLSLMRRDLAVGADEFCLVGGQCLWLATLLHQRLGESLLGCLETTSEQLSSRELDVLRWSAQGKTAGETAAILSLSERTVNFHINSAVKKLGMPNKTSAVVHAAHAGLL